MVQRIHRVNVQRRHPLLQLAHAVGRGNGGEVEGAAAPVQNDADDAAGDVGLVVLAGSAAAGLAAGAAQQAVLGQFAQAAKASGQPFSGFSADRGKAFFLASPGSGETPSCSTCHTTDPTRMGRTRVGKEIEPMATSANPERFTDLDNVEKWFRRNCYTVLGRECTAIEKGDFIAFMTSR